MKKILAILLTLALLIPCSVIVSADTIISSPDIVLTGLNESSVRQAVNRYFFQREDYLTGETDLLDQTIPAVQRDEEKHIAALMENELIRKNTVISFDSIDCSDTFAVVMVTETVTFLKQDVETTETITHRLRLYKISDDIPKVALDAYQEVTSGFSSCSYIPDSVQPLVTPVNGSGLCLVQVALNEKGVTETGSNITKYGAWAGTNGLPWCATFVSWCAAEANIPTTIIRKTSSLYHLKEDCQNHGSVHKSNANGGNYTPVPGDLFFTIGEDGGLGHVGIVESIHGNVMWCVEGNWGDQVYHTKERTIDDTDLLYFGTPGYLSTTHTYLSYDYDASGHWQVCNNCNHAGSKTLHSYVQESPGGYYVCTVCGFRSNSSILCKTNIYSVKD